MGGSLEPLKITGFTDEEFQDKIDGPPYAVMINPESLKWNRRVEYNDDQDPDSSAPSQKYCYTPSDKLSFDIVIDCTGIVDEKRTNMKTEIDSLEHIIFDFNGEIHRPNYVKIEWGSMITFKGVLETFDTSYTFFKPDGTPLRAKISLSFAGYISTETEKKLDQQQSPDITHLVNVVEGMMLPQLCQKVWKDDSRYVQVARYNDLNKFRDLTGIQKLIFPPIVQPS